MAISKANSEAIKQLGLMMLGAGVGRAARPGGRVWNTMTRENAEGFTPESDTTRNIRAATQLADAMRSDPIEFDAGIIYVPGPAQNNQMLAGRTDAFLRQTPLEHEYALSKYLDDPRIPKDRAINLGIRTERGLDKWWNDHEPRLPVTPSSSCVSSARIGPDGDIYIRFRDGGKEYQYEGSSDPVEASKILNELVGAPGESIGRKVNSWTGSWGTKHTYLPKG